GGRRHRAQLGRRAARQGLVREGRGGDRRRPRAPPKGVSRVQRDLSVRLGREPPRRARAGFRLYAHRHGAPALGSAIRGSLESGTLGRFEITDKLGEGGMGVLYRARDTRLGRTVAIKLLRPETVADPERARRFLQEARAASALNHPNIVTV